MDDQNNNVVSYWQVRNKQARESTLAALIRTLVQWVDDDKLRDDIGEALAEMLTTYEDQFTAYGVLSIGMGIRVFDDTVPPLTEVVISTLYDCITYEVTDKGIWHNYSGENALFQSTERIIARLFISAGDMQKYMAAEPTPNGFKSWWDGVSDKILGVNEVRTETMLCDPMLLLFPYLMGYLEGMYSTMKLVQTDTMESDGRTWTRFIWRTPNDVIQLHLDVECMQTNFLNCVRRFHNVFGEHILFPDLLNAMQSEDRENDDTGMIFQKDKRV